ncbi:hypothetical protein IWQ60_009423 [Tieghemiomyces parasiticus]|uniref:RING-type domain-containing protein n=1 Tax=Tieghemiomyces parasiticus TaxID=78921 RepID=A0A9W7ZUR8_9FUNG|nr:hypothetical protein IWQ60_009423 [Tieghemiomyces parasiticus]
MPRHSKNNTALGFFTYAERQMMDYGTKRQRLGTVGKRQFDACFLCHRTAKDPLCCHEGHLACKECFYEHIVAQRQEISRQLEIFEAQRTQLDRQLEQKAADRRAREITDFEKTETRILYTAPAVGKNPSVEVATTTASVPRIRSTAKPTLEKKGSVDRVPATIASTTTTATSFKERFAEVKRRRENLEESTPGAESKDVGASADRKVNNNPGFWLPSQTPEAAATLEVPDRLHPMCTAVDPPHRVGLKKLIPVYFAVPPADPSTSSSATACLPPASSASAALTTEPTTATATPLSPAVNVDVRGGSGAICPGCLKGLANHSRLCLPKKCGHVVCRPCMDSFVGESGTCLTCNKAFKPQEIVDLHYEGTGYAGSGSQIEATRYDVAIG